MSAQLIADYVMGVELPPDVVQELETHLESCADCRAKLTSFTPRDVTLLADRVWARIVSSRPQQTRPARFLMSCLIVIALVALAVILLSALIARG
ncbi:zf-HC2 domain-containing protein [Amycolatopsis sp. NPDC051371]|uniref:zf-HC2 domain-containing protein n=1 Tax=Amycolatopsis sp. NPDC051371 TaxID=3155800 RepID=UPI003412624A